MTTFTLDQKLKAVAREIAIRKAKYPKMVAAGNMKQEVADYEIDVLKEIYTDLKGSSPSFKTDNETELRRLRQTFKELHAQFYEELVGVGYLEGKYDEEALDTIVSHLRKENETKGKDNSDEGLLNVWRYIFQNWSELSVHIKKQTDLASIRKNLNEIFTQLRKGHDKKSAAKNSRDLYKQGLKEQ